jgi:hypothetical protein
MSSEIELLDNSKYLYLHQLSEPRDNSLRIVVDQAVLNSGPRLRSDVKDEELAKVLTESVPIETIPGCKRFELYWQHYIAYLVTEELVGSNGKYEDEVFSGKLLRCYTKSHFLEHLTRDTGGHFEPIQHFKLLCLNHLIDIAALEPPAITVTKL